MSNFKQEAVPALKSTTKAPSASPGSNAPKPSSSSDAHLGDGNTMSAAARRRAVVPIEQAILHMKQGTVLFKFGRSGAPELRIFALSTDCKSLQWFSKRGKPSTVSLLDLKEVRVGQHTPVFARHNRQDLSHLSFSLILPGRTVDIAAKYAQELKFWTTGLSFLCHRFRQGNGELPAFVVQLQPVVSSAGSNSASAAGGVVQSLSAGGALSHKELVESLRAEFEVKLMDLYTWGSDDVGQLGHGNGSLLTLKQPKIIQMLMDRNVRLMACGQSHCVAVTESLEAFSWGDGSDGVLGHGDEISCSSPRLIESVKGLSIGGVAAGHMHNCLWTQDNHLFAWGKGSDGRLGLGDEYNRWKPSNICLEEHGITQSIDRVICGSASTGLLTSNGKCWLWGSNFSNQLMSTMDPFILKPTKLSATNPKSVIALAFGEYHTIAVGGDGVIYTWGDGSKGQLGHGTKESQKEPKAIEALKGSRIRFIAAGEFCSACVADPGTLYCWGSGPLGLGSNRLSTKVPEQVKLPMDRLALQIALSPDHAVCVTKIEGSVTNAIFAWGKASRGKLGVGDDVTDEKHVPVMIESMQNVVVQQVCVGTSFSAALCSHRMMLERESDHCLLCKQEFKLSRRPKNCRNCGGLFCSSCSSNKLTLLRFGYTKPVRVCHICHRQIVHFEHRPPSANSHHANGTGTAGSSTHRSKHSDASSDSGTLPSISPRSESTVVRPRTERSRTTGLSMAGRDESLERGGLKPFGHLKSVSDGTGVNMRSKAELSSLVKSWEDALYQSEKEKSILVEESRRMRAVINLCTQQLHALKQDNIQAHEQLSNFQEYHKLQIQRVELENALKTQQAIDEFLQQQHHKPISKSELGNVAAHEANDERIASPIINKNSNANVDGGTNSEEYSNKDKSTVDNQQPSANSSLLQSAAGKSLKRMLAVDTDFMLSSTASSPNLNGSYPSPLQQEPIPVSIRSMIDPDPEDIFQLPAPMSATIATGSRSGSRHNSLHSIAQSPFLQDVSKPVSPQTEGKNPNFLPPLWSMTSVGPAPVPIPASPPVDFQQNEGIVEIGQLASVASGVESPAGLDASVQEQHFRGLDTRDSSSDEYVDDDDSSAYDSASDSKSLQSDLQHPGIQNDRFSSALSHPASVNTLKIDSSDHQTHSADSNSAEAVAKVASFASSEPTEGSGHGIPLTAWQAVPRSIAGRQTVSVSDASFMSLSPSQQNMTGPVMPMPPSQIGVRPASMAHDGSVGAPPAALKRQGSQYTVDQLVQAGMSSGDAEMVVWGEAVLPQSIKSNLDRGL